MSSKRLNVPTARPHICVTDRKVNIRLTAQKCTKMNGDRIHHIAGRHREIKHNINCDSAECKTYSSNYKQWLILQKLVYQHGTKTTESNTIKSPALYKRLIQHLRQTTEQWTFLKQTVDPHWKHSHKPIHNTDYTHVHPQTVDCHK